MCTQSHFTFHTAILPTEHLNFNLCSQLQSIIYIQLFKNLSLSVWVSIWLAGGICHLHIAHYIWTFLRIKIWNTKNKNCTFHHLLFDFVLFSPLYMFFIQLSVWFALQLLYHCNAVFDLHFNVWQGLAFYMKFCMCAMRAHEHAYFICLYLRMPVLHWCLSCFTFLIFFPASIVVASHPHFPANLGDGSFWHLKMLHLK